MLQLINFLIDTTNSKKDIVRALISFEDKTQIIDTGIVFYNNQPINEVIHTLKVLIKELESYQENKSFTPPVQHYYSTAYKSSKIDNSKKVLNFCGKCKKRTEDANVLKSEMFTKAEDYLKHIDYITKKAQQTHEQGLVRVPHKEKN